jgi:hypothetical protein
MPLVLCATVAASVGFGVLSAYLVMSVIFFSFGRPHRPEPVAISRPRLVLVPSQNHASGD